MEDYINKEEIQKLNKKVISKAEIEAEELIQSTRKKMRLEKKEKINNAKEYYSREYEEKIKKLENEIKERKNENERLLRALYLKKKKEIIDKIINRIIDSVTDMKDKDKKEIYSLLLEKAKREIKNISVVEVNKKDKKYVDGDFDVKINNEIIFGIKAYNKDNSIVVDATLSSMREEIYNALLERLSDKYEL